MSPGIRSAVVTDRRNRGADHGDFHGRPKNDASENLVEMLIKKDRELAQLLQVAKEQKALYDRIENVKFS